MFEPEVSVPFLVFSVPLLAIAGGIVAGVTRQIGRQRMLELVQQERIAAIQRGVDIASLPSVAATIGSDGEGFLNLAQSERRRAQNLLIGGIVLTCLGIGLSTFLWLLLHDESEPVWAVGLVVLSVGVALLLSAGIVWPRGDRSVPRA